jgi:hypothetical protein
MTFNIELELGLASDIYPQDRGKRSLDAWITEGKKIKRIKAADNSFFLLLLHNQKISILNSLQLKRSQVQSKVLSFLLSHQLD